MFDGAVTHGARDTGFVAGTAGSVMAEGPDLLRQQVTLATPADIARPVLEGQWFNDGFRGTMGALLCAIEDGHEPANGARENLRAPALTFAAVESRRTGREVAVGRGVGWPAEATTARPGGTGRGSAGGRMLQMAAPPAGPGCPQAPEQLACPDDMLALHRPRRRGSAAP